MAKKKAFFLIGVLGFVCLQVFRWESFMVRATHLELKSVVRGLSFEESFQLGLFSLTLQQYQGARRFFEKALLLRPQNLSSIGNLAVVSWKLQDLSSAENYFQAYFEGGGTGYDLMASYARFLVDQDRKEAAIEWFYRSLMAYSQSQRVANELVDLLMLSGRLHEALSVIGSLLSTEGEDHDFWKQKLRSIEFHLRDMEQLKSEPEKEFRAPALDGRRSWIPVRSEPQGSLYFLLFDRLQEDLVINESDLALWSFESLQKARAQSDGASSPLLKELWIGPWRLQDLSFRICKDCSSVLGSVILKDLQIEGVSEGALSFLLIRRPDSKDN